MKITLPGVQSVSFAVLTLLASGVHADSAQEESRDFSADQSFGAAMPASPAPITLAAAIAGIDAYAGKPIKLTGKITEVCQAKGCWMILVDGDSYARVSFKDYAFFVPVETSMQRSVIYGVLSEHVLSGEQAEHFAQDAGAQSTLELEGEVREYSLLASAVQLEARR